MAHRCPVCDSVCYCHGDIDDVELDYDGPCECEDRDLHLQEYDNDER